MDESRTDQDLCGCVPNAKEVTIRLEVPPS